MSLVNSPDPADREAVVQQDLANVLHPIVQHRVLETKQMVVTGGEDSTVVDADGTSYLIFPAYRNERARCRAGRKD